MMIFYGVVIMRKFIIGFVLGLMVVAATQVDASSRGESALEKRVAKLEQQNNKIEQDLKKLQDSQKSTQEREQKRTVYLAEMMDKYHKDNHNSNKHRNTVLSIK
jgi:cell division protein FtsB